MEECQCLDDQKSLLLQLKKNLTFDNNATDKLEGWNQSIDCCQWSGVKCNNSNGRVIGLDLSEKYINDGINNSSSLFDLQFLQSLNLGGNDDMKGEIPSAFGKLYNLTYLNLSYTGFSGQVPFEISQLVKLVVLDLSLGSELYMKRPNLATIIQNMTNMKELYLNHVDNSAMGNKWSEAVLSSLPQLQVLSMYRCGLRGEIHKSFSNLHHLRVIVLDHNSLEGPVPEFLAEFTNLTTLSLSNNDLTGRVPEKIFQAPTLRTLHLSDNENLQGTLPIFYKNGSLEELILKNTKFSGMLPNFISNLKGLREVNLNNCGFQGSIPSSISSGAIPECLIAMPQLIVLNLRGNNISGAIPDNFGTSCNLQTLDLNGNFFLQGRIPRTLAYCKALKVLDLGNNQFNDTFPCHLQSLSKLTVLVLRSNTFYGTLECQESLSMWPLLQIVDVASNQLHGKLTSQILLKWTSMMTGTNQVQSYPSRLESESRKYGALYQNTVTLAFKGNLYDLQYILTTFTSIDFSCNAFHGKIPEELGALNALKELNLSHNSFSGKIPSSIGNLSQVESLDLSCNTFSGKIPPQLENLNSLGYLNLSFNKLSGKIPTSAHLDTFDASSYKGNEGLYGPPLTPFRHDPETTASTTHAQDSNGGSESELEWMLSGAEVGFPVGIIIFFGPILYIKRYRDWYCRHLHRLVMKILRREERPRGRRSRSRQQQQQQRQRH
ncbi:Receptor-like protein 43 [Bienertia sinuspersici]